MYSWMTSDFFTGLRAHLDYMPFHFSSNSKASFPKIKFWPKQHNPNYTCTVALSSFVYPPSALLSWPFHLVSQSPPRPTVGAPSMWETLGSFQAKKLPHLWPPEGQNLDGEADVKLSNSTTSMKEEGTIRCWEKAVKERSLSLSESGRAFEERLCGWEQHRCSPERVQGTETNQ